MRFFRRSLVALGVAATLPTVVFIAVGAFYFLRAERARVEAATLRRSEIVMSLVDARLQRDMAALGALSGSIHFETGDWRAFYPRAQGVLGTNPVWSTIVLIDAERRQEIFDLRQPFGAPLPLAVAHRTMFDAVIRAAGPIVGGIDGGEQPLTWIYVPVTRGAHVRYILAAGIRPQVFQDILVSFTRAGTTAAILDRDGRFVGRSLDYEGYRGMPAMQSTREAMRADARGFYRDTSRQGVKNYTAFYTSAFSGWSAHLTVASALIDTPTAWSFVVAALAGLGTLLLGWLLIVLVLRDMSERRKAEEALGQAQKMEAVGQLTGGIAHDFNNLLTAIIGNLDMIRTRVTGNDRLQRLADNALEASRRGARLASQLLAFSRTHRMTVGPVDLSQLLQGMSSLLTQSVGPTIELKVYVDPDAQFVVSDANQLELALLNLAVNARDAMPDGGVLSITARRASDADRHLPQGDYVSLCVMDTGAGMADDVRARAIEPFFTTKPIGHGTGLGLSQVYGVVRESGGALAIESEVGRGTNVCLTLRLATAESAAAVAEAPAALPAKVATPEPEEEICVLVVDDDRLVRRFMTDCLRNLKYRVLDAGSGARALEILETARIDLLLVDFAMPGMNGAEVALAAQRRQPGLPVLVVSGYADSAAVAAALGSARQLRKPFDPDELAAAVAETLNSAEA